MGVAQSITDDDALAVMLFQRLWDLGFDAVNWLWRYFLLGAVIVIPIWLLSRLFGSPRGR